MLLRPAVATRQAQRRWWCATTEDFLAERREVLVLRRCGLELLRRVVSRDVLHVRGGQRRDHAGHHSVVALGLLRPAA